MFYMKILLTPIAVLSILSNLAVLALFLQNRAWLRKPYNVFILSLSFTDMVTGIVMFITPGIIIDEPIPLPTSWFYGSLYCKLFWSRWLLFALGAVSVYTCLFLTSERWTAISRPFKYRARFASKPLIGYILLVWFLGLATSLIGALEFEFLPKHSNSTSPPCKFAPIAQRNLIGVVAILSVSAKFVIPAVITLVLYALAILKMKKNDANLQGQTNRDKAAKSVTKMAAAASIVLVLCWLPNQIYFILVKFQLAKMFTHFHNASSVLVLLSSTLNPFIYGLWGKHFRAGLKSALCCIRRNVRGNGMTAGMGNEGFYIEKMETGL